MYVALVSPEEKIVDGITKRLVQKQLLNKDPESEHTLDEGVRQPNMHAASVCVLVTVGSGHRQLVIH